MAPVDIAYISDISESTVAYADWWLLIELSWQYQLTSLDRTREEKKNWELL